MPTLLRHCLAVALVGALAVPAAAAPPGEALLPPGAVACAVVPDVARFREAWQRTGAAKLLDDPAMKPVRDDARAGQEKGAWASPWLLGLTPQEIADMAGGELVIGLTAVGPAGPAHVLVLDVRGKADKARAVLTAARKRLQGGQRGEERIGGGTAVSYPLPARQAKGGARRVYDLFQGDHLVSTTNPAALQAVLTRLGSAGAGDSLATAAAFKASTGRAAPEVADAQFRWFVEPLGAWAALRQLRGQEPGGGTDYLAVLRKEGFGAVKGIGGAGAAGAAGQEWFVRGYVYAPKPYQRAMRMLAFTNAAAEPPPAWVPVQAGRFGVASVQYGTAFDAYATLFDALYGQGEDGVFVDIIKGLRDDPDGPRVDLRKNLVDQLLQPLVTLTLPSEGGRRRWLTAARVKDEKVVADALTRLYKDDKAAKKLPFGTYGLWQIDPPKTTKPPKEGKREWSLPPSAIAVSNGYLVYAATPDVLTGVFGATATEPLARAPEFGRVVEVLAGRAGASASYRAFFRPNDSARLTFDQLRAGPGGEGDSALTRAVRSLFPADADGPSAVDFGKLPPFDQVRRHLAAPGGAAVETLADGWKLTAVVPQLPPQ